MISILTFALLSNLRCEDFCVNPCDVLNGNYTNECGGCPVIYDCNPNFSDFYTVKWSNYENESNLDLESNPILESNPDLESKPILESDIDLINYSFWNITKYLKYLEA